MHFKGVAIVFSLTAFIAGFIFHSPIPAKVPDQLVFQALVDVLSFSETMGSIFERFGWNRWLAYPGRIFLSFSLFKKVPEGMDIVTVQLEDVNCVVIKPQEFLQRTTKGPAVVVYHGGGWVFGNLDSYMPLLIDLAEETGFLVMSPEYRRAPENPFPIPFEDCLNSTLAFMKNAHGYNVDPTKIVLAGDSAGGNLAMAITAAIIKMKQLETSIYTPAMLGLIYPKLQMHNYLLPSYRQNQKFIFSKDLIPKFFLAYVGLNDRLDLASVICENGHIDVTDEELTEECAFVHERNVPEKYKKRPYDTSVEPLPAVAKKRLDKKTQQYIQSKFLDDRIAPLLVSNETLLRFPPTHILVCEYDPLRDDGILLFERMKSLKKEASLQYLPDSLHAAMSVGSVHKGLYHAQQNSILFKKIKDRFS